MKWTRQEIAFVAASVLGLAGLVTGGLLLFSGGSTPARRDTARPASIPAVSHPAGPLRSPFTGERIPYLRRVLAVKIDNIVYARPQTGLGSADIVYVLPVEGGLSRFMAIGQFGRPAFA